MSRRQQQNKILRWLLVAASLLGVCGFGLGVLRDEADGLQNALSTKYWAERFKGDDLYEASDHLFKRGSREHREVCFTFDDGPHPQSCREILEILRSYNVQATFFLVGSRIKEHPELVRMILDEGHEVGNHTQDHQRLDTLTPAQIRNELADCETNFHRATGAKMTLMRPPGMRYNDEVLKIAKEMGYTTVGWNVGAKDFLGKADAEVIEERVLDHVKNGSIILLHDSPDTAAALPGILAKMRAEGYTFRTVTEMLARLPKPVTVPTNAYTVAAPAAAVHHVVASRPAPRRK